MKILIFEDNKSDYDNLTDCIFKFFNEKGTSYKIDICPNKEFLFNYINKYDILFLDIELGDENGIDLGLELRQRHEKCIIIITSNFAKYVFDGYKIHADRYFLKPINYIEFKLEMNSVIKNYMFYEMGINDPEISKKKIYYRDILYIDIYDRKSRIHLMNGTILISSRPLYAWIKELENLYFGQPHKTFLVNYNHISGFKKNDIILINEELIPLSRHFRKEFEQGYINYLHETL